MLEENCHKKLLVLGIGNILCGDDGIGPILAERLLPLYRENKQVDILNGGTIGLGLLYLFENYDHVLFLDAVDVGAQPGTVFKYTLEDLETIRSEKMLSSHQSDPFKLALYAETIGCLPKNVAVLGIQIGAVRPEIGLSESLQSNMVSIEKEIINQMMYILKHA
ncbi:MAG: hydrogenase maturation protease [Bacillota bacterium]